MTVQKLELAPRVSFLEGIKQNPALLEVDKMVEFSLPLNTDKEEEQHSVILGLRTKFSRNESLVLIHRTYGQGDVTIVRNAYSNSDTDKVEHITDYFGGVVQLVVATVKHGTWSILAYRERFPSSKEEDPYSIVFECKRLYVDKSAKAKEYFSRFRFFTSEFLQMDEFYELTHDTNEYRAIRELIGWSSNYSDGIRKWLAKPNGMIPWVVLTSAMEFENEANKNLMLTFNLYNKILFSAFCAAVADKDGLGTVVEDADEVVETFVSAYVDFNRNGLSDLSVEELGIDNIINTLLDLDHRVKREDVTEEVKVELIKNLSRSKDDHIWDDGALYTANTGVSWSRGYKH